MFVRQIRDISRAEIWTEKTRKDSVDWIVNESDDAALFLECKSKRLSWGAKMSLSDQKPLETDLEYLADAVVQTYKTIIDYQANLYGQLPYSPNRKIYPVVVTLENWYFLGPAMRDRLVTTVESKLEENGMSKGLPEEMPYQIWAIEEAEVGLQLIDDLGREGVVS